MWQCYVVSFPHFQITLPTCALASPQNSSHIPSSFQFDARSVPEDDSGSAASAQTGSGSSSLSSTMAANHAGSRKSRDIDGSNSSGNGNSNGNNNSSESKGRSSVQTGRGRGKENAHLLMSSPDQADVRVSKRGSVCSH